MWAFYRKLWPGQLSAKITLPERRLLLEKSLATTLTN